MAAARVGGVDGDAPAVASQTCRPIPILVSAAPPSGAGGKRRRHLVPPPRRSVWVLGSMEARPGERGRPWTSPRGAEGAPKGLYGQRQGLDGGREAY